MSDVQNLVGRLRQIAESQWMDFDSPNVAATLDDAATTLEALASIGSVVAEEPEWEYGVGWNYFGATAPMGTRYTSREGAEGAIRQYPEDQDFGPNFLVRRTPEQPAGPWVPVEQGDER